MVFNFALVSSTSSTYPRAYACGFDSAATPLQNYFEYPEGYAC